MLEKMILRLWGRIDTSMWHFDDPYNEWVYLLRRELRSQLTNYDEAYHRAEAYPAEAYHLARVVEVGRKQLAAPCANRSERLLQLKKMSNTLELYKENGK